MELSKNERIDLVNDGLSLIQNGEGLTFGTDALLLAGYIKGGYDHGIEIGSGSGIITMLMLYREKLKSAECLEIQEDYATLTERNAELNALRDRMQCICTDARSYRPKAECDIVYMNPPYMRADSGRANLCDKKNIARHEVNGGIDEMCKSAARMLKYGGTLAVVYRPDRLCDLICAMRDAGAEAKRMTLVYADATSVPCIVLAEGKRGARSSLRMTRPLMIYRDARHSEYSEDMQRIMDEGMFPKDFYI